MPIAESLQVVRGRFSLNLLDTTTYPDFCSVRICVVRLPSVIFSEFRNCVNDNSDDPASIDMIAMRLFSWTTLSSC